jgi:CO/xanthine dehydrogenase Mo-binding subunit
MPHLAHASREPPVAVAEFKNGQVEAWAPTQNPHGVQDTVAKALGIKPTDIACHVTVLGGGPTQIKAGLRRGSGHSTQATGQAREGGVDSRGRYSLRLLSRCGGHVHQGGDG